jgi:uncharacterized protein (UPF0276 family)
VATTSDARRRTADRTGIGLRLPHVAEVVATRPLVGWLEIHPENFLANPHALELLMDLARDYPISVHTVGISIGSADGIDVAHLRRLLALVDRLNPVMVSGHLAWSAIGGTYLNDLLPLPYTEETLRIVSDQLARVQDGLGRPYAIENPSSYLSLATSTMTELEFLHALVDKTGCRLLCDVSNIHLSGHNMGHDPYAVIDTFPADAVVELHLGGFTAEDDDATPGGTVLIDTHAQPVAKAVWKLYAHAIQRFGALPTIIEWDNDLPELGILTAEAATADAVRTQTREGGVCARSLTFRPAFDRHSSTETVRRCVECSSAASTPRAGWRFTSATTQRASRVRWWSVFQRPCGWWVRTW